FGHDGGWTIREVNRKGAASNLDLVFRAVSNSHRLAIKCNAQAEKNRQQFDALLRMHRLGVDCARPVWIAEDESLYVMEWLAGADLRQRMQGARRLEVIAATGRWLREFHRRSAAWVPRRDPMLRTVVPPGRPRDLSLAVAERLERRRLSLRLAFGPTAALHTDFQLQNLAARGGRIYAYDPVRPAIGNVYGDVTRFLITTEIQRGLANMRGQRWPDCSQTDRAAFLFAYGTVPRMWRSQFEVLEDLQLGQLWRASIRRGDHRLRPAARHRLIERIMRRRGILDHGESAIPGRG
ncbi:phosphotransferase, partial [Paracoccus spongiarum]